MKKHQETSAALQRLARLAQSQGRAGEWAAARVSWQSCLAAAADPAPQAWLLGALRAAAALGEVDETRRATAHLLARYPESGAARLALLRLLIHSRSRDALAEEIERGSLRDGASFEALFPHFRALLALERQVEARAAFDRLLPIATTPTQLHLVADRAAICFAHEPMRARWNAAAEKLNRLPPSADPARDAPIARTLRLRRDIATRDYDAFLRDWNEGREVLPAWAAKLAPIAERLRRPGFPDRTARKIFGIGLSKTGTTSLGAALDILGWQTAHFRSPVTYAVIEDADFDLYDALNDGPVAARFEALHSTYPNARFILTTRPFESWEASVRGHHLRTRGSETQRDLDRIIAVEGPDSPMAARLLIHNAIWRHPDLATVYARWTVRVDTFFADKPAPLLRFSVFDGHGWAELCAFLAVDVPAVPFPHENKNVRGSSLY